MPPLNFGLGQCGVRGEKGACSQRQGGKTDLHGKSFKVLKINQASLWIIYDSSLYSDWR
jgi:hypothetical protein